MYSIEDTCKISSKNNEINCKENANTVANVNKGSFLFIS